MKPKSVLLSIDELVLHGFSPGDRHRIGAAVRGELARLLAEDQPGRARAYCDRLQALFPDRLYIEISRRDDPVETAAEAPLIDLAYDRDLPLVATNPSCFAEARFGDAHDAIYRIAAATESVAMNSASPPPARAHAGPALRPTGLNTPAIRPSRSRLAIG